MTTTPPDELTIEHLDFQEEQDYPCELVTFHKTYGNNDVSWILTFLETFPCGCTSSRTTGFVCSGCVTAVRQAKTVRCSGCSADFDPFTVIINWRKFK